MFMKKYFVSAIHTDAGKTFVSSLLVKASNGDYWKPIQSGSDERDSDYILSQNKSVKVFPEAFLLKSPESPHSAAAKEGVFIEINKIKLPKTDNHLIVEGAGGILVPINPEETISDLILALDLPLILVVPTYLGCINHSLLTLEAIKSRGLNLAGIIFNGVESPEAEEIITKKSGSNKIYRIPRIDSKNISEIERITFELRDLFF